MFFVISFAFLLIVPSTVPTHNEVFPPESLLKKNKAHHARSEKAAVEKAESKKVGNPLLFLFCCTSFV